MHLHQYHAKGKAPADTGPRDAVGPSGGNRENLPPQFFSDSTLTLPHIQLSLEDVMQEMDLSAADAPTSGVASSPIRLWFTTPDLGHPLIDDNHDRPLHPLVGPFLRGYLSRHEDMNDDDDDMGHLYTGLGDTRVLAGLHHA